MKTLITCLVVLFGAFVPSQLSAQSQLTINPNNPFPQLNLTSIVKVSPNEYEACGIIQDGGDFGVGARFSDSQITWSKAFGFGLSFNLEVMAVASNGDAIVTGTEFAKGFVVRLDHNGNPVWFANINVTGGPGESFTDIVEAISGDIYVTGRRDNGMFVARLSSAGTILWQKQPVSSQGLAAYSRALLSGDSTLVLDDPYTGGGIAGDISLRVLDSGGTELFRRMYGVPENVRDQLTSVTKIPNGYAIATIRGNEIGIIKLDHNLNIAGSRTYTASVGGALVEGKILYDSGSLYMSGARRHNNNVELPRAFVAKLDTATLGVVWTRVLSSGNSIPASEPFMDGTLRVPHMRWPSLGGATRGVVLASIDPVTGEFTGTACENPTPFTLVPGPYTGLVETSQVISAWTDVISGPNVNYSLNNYPLTLEDCEPGVLADRLLHIRAFLAGPYDQNTGVMWDSLRVQGIVPTTDVAYGSGASVSPSVFGTVGANAIVDWIQIQIRDPINPATVLESIPALIQRDGDVVGLNGVSLPVTSLSVGNYYMSLRHRSHLEVCTETAVAVSSVVDFTLPATSTYGTEASKNISGVMLMWEGDVLFNDNIKYVGAENDRDPILSVIGGSVPTDVVTNVYSNADVNMDGLVKYVGIGNDRDPILSVIGGSIPTNIRVAQLP